MTYTFDNIYTTPEHTLLRDQVAKFIAREVEPFAEAWEQDGKVPREVLRKMGQAGLLGLMYDPKLGGGGADAMANLVFAEALSQSTLRASSLPCWFTPTWPVRICIMLARRLKKPSTCPASQRASASRQWACPNLAQALTWQAFAPQPNAMVITGC
jgi:hypothetical protein